MLECRHLELRGNLRPGNKVAKRLCPYYKVCVNADPRLWRCAVANFLLSLGAQSLLFRHLDEPPARGYSVFSLR